MSLAIRTKTSPSTAERSAGTAPDDALATLAKLVPADALAAYVALVAIAPGDSEDKFLFGFFLVGVAFTILFLYVSARRANEWPPIWQWPLRVLGFVVYAMAVSKPFAIFCKDLDPRYAQAGVVILSTLGLAVGALNSKDRT